jgi:hypothetical protein
MKEPNRCPGEGIDTQAWLNNNRKIRKVFVIISDAEAFRAKPVSLSTWRSSHSGS